MPKWIFQKSSTDQQGERAALFWAPRLSSTPKIRSQFELVSKVLLKKFIKEILIKIELLLHLGSISFKIGEIERMADFSLAAGTAVEFFSCIKMISYVNFITLLPKVVILSVIIAIKLTFSKIYHLISFRFGRSEHKKSQFDIQALPKNYMGKHI